MTITVTCECGKKLKANPENAGMKGRCPDCGKVFVIPTPETDDIHEAAMKRLCAEAATLRNDWKQPGSLEKAEALFRRVVDEHGHYWAGHYGLANTLLFQFTQHKEEPDYQKRAEALDELKKATKLAPHQREPLLELARRTAPLEIKEGKRFYQKAMRAADEEQEPLFHVEWQSLQHYKFGVAAAEASLNALAIDAFCRAIELNRQQYQSIPAPASVKAQACWGLALKKLGLAGDSS